MDLNTVDWSRICGEVQYSGGIEVCVLARHPRNEEHYFVPAHRLPAELTPCQRVNYLGGVLYVCALYGRHMNRECEWVRPSELRGGQARRYRRNPTGPEPGPVRHPTPEKPLCLHPNPIDDGSVCALPPDHGLSGHGHYYVKFGGPLPGQTVPQPGDRNGGGTLPASQPIGRRPGQPDDDYDSRREPEPQPKPAPRTPTTGGGTAGMASVAEVKAMIDAALIEVSEGQQALHAAAEKLTQAQHSLAAATQGGAHDAITSSIGALENAVRSTEDALASTLVSVEQAQAYEASL